jgi:hypothetical protein
MSYPNIQLKDIGMSGVSGGSSSVFSRKESLNAKFYVPLKRRITGPHEPATHSIIQTVSILEITIFVIGLLLFFSSPSNMVFIFSMSFIQ